MPSLENQEWGFFYYYYYFFIAQVMLITHDRCMIDEIRVIW